MPHLFRASPLHSTILKVGPWGRRRESHGPSPAGPPSLTGEAAKEIDRDRQWETSEAQRQRAWTPGGLLGGGEFGAPFSSSIN